jgi:hypothetical protein
VPKKVLKKLEVELRDLEVRLRDIWIGTRDPYLSIVLLVLDSRDPYRVFHSDQQLFRRLLGKKSTRRGGTFGPNRKKRSDAGTTGARKKRSDAGIKRGPNKRTTGRRKRSYSRHRHAPTTTRFRMRSLRQRWRRRNYSNTTCCGCTRAR